MSLCLYEFHDALGGLPAEIMNRYEPSTCNPEEMAKDASKKRAREEHRSLESKGGGTAGGGTKKGTGAVIYSMQWLLGDSMSTKQFYDAHWEKKPLVVKR